MYITECDLDNSDCDILYTGDDIIQAILNMTLIGHNRIRMSKTKKILISGQRYSFNINPEFKLPSNFHLNEIILNCEEQENLLEEPKKFMKYSINNNLYTCTFESEEELLKNILNNLKIEYHDLTVELDYDFFDFDDGSSWGDGYIFSINGQSYDYLKAYAGYNECSYYTFYDLLGAVLSILKPNEIYRIEY